MRKRTMFMLLIIFAVSALHVNAESGKADRVINEAQAEVVHMIPELRKNAEAFFDGADAALPEMLKPSEVIYEDAFRVIRKNGYLVKSFRECGSFSFLKDTEGDFWMIPLCYDGKAPTGYLNFSAADGKMEFFGGGRVLEKDSFPFSYERLRESVNSSELIHNEIEEYHVVQNLKYRIYYVYLRSEKDEFIIPLDSVLTEAGLKKDTVYAAEDFIEKIDAYFDEEYDAMLYREAAEKGEYLYGSGVITRSGARMMEKSAAEPRNALPAAQSDANGMNILLGLVSTVALLVIGGLMLSKKS